MADEEFLSKVRSDIKDIFHSAIKSGSPKKIIQNKVKLEDETLCVEDHKFPLKERVYLVGFGKAVMHMAVEMEKILGNRLVRGIISVPIGSKESAWNFDEMSTFPNIKTTKIDICEGAANNQPDTKSLNATHDILDLVETLTETDTLIVLISGGGSALLYMPRPMIDVDDKMRICRELQNAGANIVEVNSIRRKLSLVKGGGLARMAYPASVISLIMSDVIGDPLDLIASGPTVYNPKKADESIAVLKKYDLLKSVDGDLKYTIFSSEKFDDKPLLTPERTYKHVNNIILANNVTAIKGAYIESLRKKFIPIILRNDIEGNVHDISLAYALVTSLICLASNKAISKEEFTEAVNKSKIISLENGKITEIFCLVENMNGEGLFLIGAGEPTVKVTGEGKGGRNQELALYFSLDWLAKIKSNPRLANFEVVMFSGGTDGQDGPTDAAGAFGYPAFAPIVYKLQEILKLIAIEELTKPQEIVKKVEEKKEENPHQKYILSDYLTAPPAEPKEKEEVLTPYDEEDAIQALSDEQYEEKFKTELMLMEVERMIPENALKENDSYNFFSRFKKGKDLHKTGVTGTNLMDLHFIYIKRRDCKCEFYPKDITLTRLEDHDLHIDPETIRRHRINRMRFRFKKDMSMDKPVIHKRVLDRLNLKIIDENLRDPCCNKQRKSLKPSDEED